jgi:Ca2+-binding RTX toxin-like protein
VGCWGDKIYGLAGNDTLNGRGGGDILNGGPGNDKLDGGERKDYFYGVSGNDSINTADKQADNRISCGDGYDTVRYDRYLDVPDGDCEKKMEVLVFPRPPLLTN